MSTPLISRLRELGRDERRVLCEAAMEILLARLVVMTVPYRLLTRWLRRPRVYDNRVPDPSRLEMIARSLHVAARRLPWHNSCLTRAIAGRRMLNRRGIASTLSLGVARTDAQTMRAHSWLEVGQTMITGGEESRDYNAVAVYSDESGRSE